MKTKARNLQTSNNVFQQLRLQRGLAFGLIIVMALIAFETFNYSTTDFALNDLLGDLTFMGVISWATILAIAFCGIDFAGIARLFTPDNSSQGRNEAWYLFGAWLLAATMNALLTWWGVSIAIMNQQALGNSVVERETLLRIVPIFVAILVWLIRVLIIGTFSVAGDRLFSQTGRDRYSRRPQVRPAPSAQPARSLSAASARPRTATSSNESFRPAPKPKNQPDSGSGYSRPEPVYTPVQMRSVNPHTTKDQKPSGPFSSRVSMKS